MPKLKTKSSAKKRFKISATGKVMMAQAGKRHGMIKRTNSQIRKLRGTTVMSKQDGKKAVKGQWGRRKNTIRVAKQAMEKAMQYAYRDRRTKKREFKSLWIQRINAGVRSEGLTYSKFISGLTKSGIKLDRKILAEIAYDSPEAFKTIVQKAQSALN
jgi:large subunit ribosomal protein L20